jgi:type IV secretory pathway VirB4 component
MMAGAPNATQTHLPIAGIQDGVVIMNDGSVRAVLKAEPINFDLKSELEQNGIIYAYQGFLNSLDFPIQITVQSKRLDLERYLMRLEESSRDMTNDLLRIQTNEYIGFVRYLINVTNIMSKSFFVTVSYSPLTKGAAAAQVGGLFHRKPTGPLMDSDQFQRFQGEVNNRAGIIAGGLARMGIKSRLLETQELIELFYGIYNPDFATEERLVDVEGLSSGVVHTEDIVAPPQ